MTASFCDFNFCVRWAKWQASGALSDAAAVLGSASRERAITTRVPHAARVRERPLSPQLAGPPQRSGPELPASGAAEPRFAGHGRPWHGGAGDSHRCAPELAAPACAPGAQLRREGSHGSGGRGGRGRPGGGRRRPKAGCRGRAGVCRRGRLGARQAGCDPGGQVEAAPRIPRGESWAQRASSQRRTARRERLQWLPFARGRSGADPSPCPAAVPPPPPPPQVRGLVRQHVESYDHFIEEELEQIIKANSMIRSEVRRPIWRQHSRHRAWAPASHACGRLVICIRVARLLWLAPPVGSHVASTVRAARKAKAPLPAQPCPWPEISSPARRRTRGSSLSTRA